MLWNSPVLSNPGYRADIDGMRALAIVFVLFGHFFKDYFPGGFIGVDIFFVISGYLISTLIFKGLNEKRFSFLNFYTKRARRIFPALIFMLLGSVLLGAVFLTPVEYLTMGGNGFRGAFFVENFWLARGGSYFDLAMARNPMMHLWSLGIEEQFYLIFPLLMWLSWRYLGLKTGWVVLALVVVSFVFGMYYLQESESRAYFWPHARFWELGVGSLLAFCNVHRSRVAGFDVWLSWFEQCGVYFTPVAFGLLVVFVFCWSNQRVYPGLWALIPSLATFCLIGCGQGTALNRWFAKPAVVYVGWLSYPLYLWHWMLYSICYCAYDGEIPGGALAIVLCVTALMSVLSLHFIEFPIRRCQPTATLLVKILCVLILTGLACGCVKKLDGIPSRIDGYVPLVNAAEHTERSALFPCRYGQDKDLSCWSSSLTQDATVVLTGNSHAQHLAKAFMTMAPSDISSDVLAEGGIIPLYGIKSGPKASDRRRDETRDWMFETIAKSASGFVVISNTWFAMPPSDSSTVATRRGEVLTVDAAFRRTIELFTSRGKIVVLMLDNPHQPHEIEACLNYRPVSFVHPNCNLPVEEYRRQAAGSKAYFASLTQMYPGKVYVIDASNGVCRKGFCPVALDGNVLYADSHHLTEFGAKQFAGSLWPQLERIVRAHAQDSH